MDPAREVGGDFYDFFMVDETHLAIVIADVSGKGISAGMLSAFVKAAYDKTLFSPRGRYKQLKHEVCRAQPRREKTTSLFAAVRIDEESITYSMAGHNVPILLKTGSGITRIMLNSPPVSNWFDNPSYYEDVIPYRKGDILVLLTDGVTECKIRAVKCSARTAR